MSQHNIGLYLMVFALFSCKQEQQVSSEKYTFFIGTYTQKEGHVDGKGDGIYLVELDMTNKTMKYIDTLSDLVNPSYLVATNMGNKVYCVNEISPNEKNWPGRISVFEKDSVIGYRKSQEAGTFGNAPCHISINKDRSLFSITNYMGGNLCYGTLDNNGKLNSEIKYITFSGKSTHPRQEAPHLHQSIFTKDGNVLLVSDLGADSIRVLDYKDGTLILKNSIATDASDGPRHMVLSSDEKLLYVLNELSNTVGIYTFDSQSRILTFKNKVKTLPSDFSGENTGGDIHISKNGQYLYASNRGHNSIVTYKIMGDNLELLQHTRTGDIPRNFTITKDGSYMICANQNSDDLYIYEIETNGNLNLVQKFAIPTPVCIEEI